MNILKVSANQSNSIAGALAGLSEKMGQLRFKQSRQTLNQAIKAYIARGFVAPSGIELICIPAFTDVEIDGTEKTAIKLIVEPRKS